MEKGGKEKGGDIVIFHLFGWGEKREKKENRVDGVFHLGPHYYYIFLIGKEKLYL